MLTCPEGDTGRECVMDFLSLWVSSHVICTTPVCICGASTLLAEAR